MNPKQKFKHSLISSTYNIGVVARSEPTCNYSYPDFRPVWHNGICSDWSIQGN